MRAEIQRLQRTLGVTTIYVTHDQTEAMTMGDRIAVMRAGTLQQVDTPERVYQWPANEFVAGFIGSPAMNMVDARLTRPNGEFHVSFGESTLVLDDELIAARPALLAYEGATVTLGIRPEDFEDAAFASEARAGRTLDTVCRLREALGSEVLVHFPVGSASLRRTRRSSDGRARGRAAAPGRRHEATALLRARQRSRDLRRRRSGCRPSM